MVVLSTDLQYVFHGVEKLGKTVELAIFEVDIRKEQSVDGTVSRREFARRPIQQMIDTLNAARQITLTRKSVIDPIVFVIFDLSG